jgi:hypothetical protein
LISPSPSENAKPRVRSEKLKVFEFKTLPIERTRRSSSQAARASISGRPLPRSPLSGAQRISQSRRRPGQVPQQLLDQIPHLGQAAGPAGGFGQITHRSVTKAEVVGGITGLDDPAQVLKGALVLASAALPDSVGPIWAAEDRRHCTSL